MSDERKKRSAYVFVAWASPCVGVAISVAFWVWTVNHVGTRGERASTVLLLYLILLLASLAGVLAAVISLFGIRSRWNALLIVPGALLGTCLNGYNAAMWFLSYALEGRNPGG
jgi:hypothetical protein